MLPDANRVVGAINTVTTPDNAEYDLCPSDPNRVALILSPNITGGSPQYNAYLVGDAPLVWVTTGSDKVILNWANHGPLVGARWTVSGGFAGFVTSVYTARYTG